MNLKITSTLLVLLLLAVSGCLEEKGQGNLTVLRIGYQPSTHQLAHVTAMEKGWWAEDLAPYGIKEVQDFEFPSGPPEMQAMLAGDLDIAYVGAAPPITAISKGLDAKIVACVNTQGSDLVLRNEVNYTGPQDLKGLKIATFPGGSIQDTILRAWLQEKGLNPDRDVRLVPMGPGNAITALNSGSVEGVFLPHPAPAIIEAGGQGRSVLRSGEMLPGHACCVLLVSGRLIRENPDLVKQIIKTHIKATKYNNEHKDEAAQLAASKFNMDPEIVKKSLEEWDGTWCTNPSPIVMSTLEYAKVQYKLGYIPSVPAREDLFNTDLYNKTTQ